MKKRSKITIFLLISFVLFPLLGHPIFADNVKENPAGAVGFTYSIDYPSNQIQEAGYFDLLMTPDQKQTVKIKLSNPSAKKVKVLVGINGAKTNKNGVVEFGDTEIKNDKSLKFAFEDIIKGPKEVSLAPGESKDLELEITMPKTEFDGVILGGIRLIRDDSADQKAGISGAQIKNKYQYIIGMTLQVNQHKVMPALELNSVYADQFNYQNTVFINFSNTKAAMLSDMSIEVQISKQGEGNVLYETKKKGMRLAPNSFIDFPVSMQGERMVAGNYSAHILVQGSDDVREEWTKDFEITKEEADKFNTRDVGLVAEKGINWLVITLIAGGAILGIGLIYWLLTIIKTNQKNNKVSKKISNRRKKSR
ncbi:DUF916 and DUF3324 domain-containing protein [uncultured Vagococcus sp.]|uniref:DUF916 and DUF3324 domain-containing protein n=1 Tax=uncultured Vagococcus sp. TaxID=189676 RepID=UPI0028D21578|nr:DUF916 and DUF3324 domain-containing protein [uncultured Vagococcus sp.]